MKHYKLECVRVVDGFICDNCGKVDRCDTVTLGFGFGSSLDCSPDFHFCSDECLELMLRNPSWRDVLGSKIPEEIL